MKVVGPVLSMYSIYSENNAINSAKQLDPALIAKKAEESF
jgi:hypothetical protein